MKYKHIVYLIALGLYVRFNFWFYNYVLTNTSDEQGTYVALFAMTVILNLYLLGELVLNQWKYIKKHIVKPISKFLNRKVIDK